MGGGGRGELGTQENGAWLGWVEWGWGAHTSHVPAHTGTSGSKRTHTHIATRSSQTTPVQHLYIASITIYLGPQLSLGKEMHTFRGCWVWPGGGGDAP
jgi:hypothetical protein